MRFARFLSIPLDLLKGTAVEGTTEISEKSAAQILKLYIRPNLLLTTPNQK
jgi:hypothetical protein